MSKWVVTLHEKKSIKQLKDAGADEILLSVPFFSLRGAHLFAIEELQDIINEIHSRGLLAAINCTRFFMEDELPALRAFLKFLKECKIDHIYFADEGVLYEGARLQMSSCFVYQPDTLIANQKDVAFYLSQGCVAVSLSREITLAEIQQIASNVDGCEVLVHGRFSIMHSRRPLLSSYFSFIGKKERVKDRRDLQLQESTRTQRMPIIEDESGTHVFSEYTLESFAQIQKMQDAGVTRFRIDSIFHDDAWTIAALQDYHAVLQGKVAAEEIVEKWKEQKDENYSEGFYYTKTTLVK